MLLLLDNYDSFVHNLARYFRRLGLKTDVVRSDKIDIAGINRLKPRAIVLSPGPKTPVEAGCCLDVVREYAGRLPILGVCLGHQTIAQAFGADISICEPMHGMASLIHHHGTGVFEGLPSPFNAGRYHSLVAQSTSMPDCLNITAWTQADSDSQDPTVMGIEHREYAVHGVQFHPESILTEHGLKIVANFVRCADLDCDADAVERELS